MKVYPASKMSRPSMKIHKSEHKLYYYKRCVNTEGKPFKGVPGGPSSSENTTICESRNHVMKRNIQALLEEINDLLESEEESNGLLEATRRK